MAWQFDHVLGQIDRFANATDKDQIANEPFVVVSIVVDLVRHDLIANHMRVIDTCRRFLLPGSVSITMQATVSMTRHVPHVSNARCALAAFRCRI